MIGRDLPPTRPTCRQRAAVVIVAMRSCRARPTPESWRTAAGLAEPAPAGCRTGPALRSTENGQGFSDLSSTAHGAPPGVAGHLSL